MNDRIPTEARRIAAARTGEAPAGPPPRKRPAASGARILTAGASVAVGVALVGAMASAAAAQGGAEAPAATEVRIVIEQLNGESPVRAQVELAQPASASTDTSTPATTSEGS